ncbi:hypothetical protein A4A49_25157 [Nicotiana attenuata]|uniref:Uncharacterized protein n=1 Tax=Nicotiana attenuata TaxID=49451 RepID=A0A314KS27_NICAT|nr:hypothetical protein A4A49_25157 [Nicotiana attenuata]
MMKGTQVVKGGNIDEVAVENRVEFGVSQNVAADRVAATNEVIEKPASVIPTAVHDEGKGLERKEERAGLSLDTSGTYGTAHKDITSAQKSDVQAWKKSSGSDGAVHQKRNKSGLAATSHKVVGSADGTRNANVSAFATGDRQAYKDYDAGPQITVTANVGAQTITTDTALGDDNVQQIILPHPSSENKVGLCDGTNDAFEVVEKAEATDALNGGAKSDNTSVKKTENWTIVSSKKGTPNNFKMQQTEKISTDAPATVQIAVVDLKSFKQSDEISNKTLILDHDQALLDALDSPKPHKCAYSAGSKMTSQMHFSGKET